LLELTGAHDGQQTLDGAFTLLAPRPEHNLAPLNCRAQGSLGGGMPRDGLCRVRVSRTPLLAADLSFALGDVSA
jgi:hypothetical protein